ncbi:Hsp70 family protein [Dactylosporangium roseum]|uniref:Hsp70 family protein n=1 Tax=Dactylosporangium roseum TaxID=47989 RepID=UPI0021B23D91|nr:Hsp70 family protein [Dactylosporangium roseum]
MPTPGIRLGVDFGTSNTVAVVRWPDGRSRPLLFEGSPLLPSAVYAEPAGQIVVGRDAVHSARLEPARFEPNPKRRIDEGTVLLGDREVAVNDLIAAVLRRVRDEWTRTVGGEAPDVTVTFPASWGATRRLSIADAAAAAGLGRVRLVPEPVAAAAYFTQVLGHEVPVGSVVVVHDFGAGTFDASVVARTAGGFEVLAVDGRDDIGGIDVDNAIVAHIGSICRPQDPAAWQRLMSPATVEDRRHRRMLWDDVRVAKERLSRQPSADLTVPLLNVDVHLTREELERLAQPLLEQTVRVTQGVMRWAQLSEDSIAGVFLVGGSSRMPLVATLLHRALGAAPVVIEQPELVVAEGSMLAGSTAIPAAAAPAPGPATGVFPRVPGFDWQQPAPTSGPPAGAFGPAGAAGPGGVGAVDGLLWPDLGSINGDAPVSAAPMSGIPASGPPAGHPTSGPPAGYPTSGPPAGGPLAGAGPVFAPPGNPRGPAGGARSGTYTAGQVPGPPPGSNRPVSAPPQRPTGAGRVFVSGGAGPAPKAEPATRYDEYGKSVRPDEAPPLPRSGPARQATPSRPRPVEGERRRGPFARAVLTLFTLLLLVLTPVAAGYVSYYLTTDRWPPPVRGWLGDDTSP